MATVINDIQPGLSPNPNGSPATVGTTLTGPVFAGTVFNSDGTGNLAGVGNTTGTQNIGYVQMVQSAVIKQSAGGCSITIPAQSQITDIYLMVTTAWTGAASTCGIGTTASATAFTAANAVTASALGQITITPGTGATQIGNWDNVGNTDVQLFVTSTNTGSGVGTLTVFYVQGINLAS
jgi:hypothetical protein